MIDTDPIPFVCGLIFGALIAFVVCVVCLVVPKEQELKAFKKYAIENNHAEYKTDSDGVTVFTWKDAK